MPVRPDARIPLPVPETHHHLASLAAEVHHEYLHHVLGASHNRRFHQHERQFRYHREAQEWIRRNLMLLLGRPKKRQVPPVAETAQPVQAALF